MYWLSRNRDFKLKSHKRSGRLFPRHSRCVYLCVFGCLVVAVNMQRVAVERPRQLLGLPGKHAAAIFTFVTTASFHSHADPTNRVKC